MRRPAAAILIIATTTLLAGCSSVPNGEVGITVSGDQVVAVIGLCSGYTTSAIRMDAFGASILFPGHRWTFDPMQVGEVALGSRDDVVALVGDHAIFSVLADGSLYDPRPVTPTVDRQAIEHLSDGEIIARDGSGTVILDQAGFDALVAATCDG